MCCLGKYSNMYRNTIATVYIHQLRLSLCSLFGLGPVQSSPLCLYDRNRQNRALFINHSYRGSTTCHQFQWWLWCVLVWCQPFLYYAHCSSWCTMLSLFWTHKILLPWSLVYDRLQTYQLWCCCKWATIKPIKTSQEACCSNCQKSFGFRSLTCATKSWGTIVRLHTHKQPFLWNSRIFLCMCQC